MRIEINEKFTMTNDTLSMPQGGIVMVTPPIGEDYWLYRIRLSEAQAIVAFPKFGTIGIGFQVEEDWNTNLPWTCDAREIYDHISHNKGDDSITPEAVIKAIEAIQDALHQRETNG